MLLVSLLLAATLGSWTSNGPGNGSATALVSATPDARILYAGTSAGVFRSDDRGRTWRNASGIAGEPLRNVTLLSVHPSDPDILFAVKQLHEYWGEVYRSLDGGAHWTLVPLPTPLLPRSIRFDSVDPYIIYIGSDCQLYFVRNGPRAEYHEAAGVFRSTDGGNTWTNMKPTGSCVEALSLDPLVPSHLYVRRDFGAFEESFDRGETWRAIPYGEGQVVPGDGVVVDPRDGKTRYGIVDLHPARFVVSTDGGITWTTRTPVGVTGWRYESLTVDPGTGRLFLGTDEGLFRSGDGGNTWIHISSVPTTIINGTVVDPATRHVVTATAFGLYSLEFPYASAIPTGAYDRGTNIYRLGRDPKDGQRLFASTEDDASSGRGWEGRLFRSRDGGATWELLPQTETTARQHIAVDAAGDLYALTRGTATLYRLRRDADAFEAIPIELNGDFYDVMADPVRPGSVYLFGLFGSYVSRDAGETWEQWVFPGTSSVDISVSDPNVVVGTTYGALIGTTDGLNWFTTEIENQRPNPVAIAPSDPATVYFVMEGGADGRPSHVVGRSRDGGRSWTRMTAPNTGSDTVGIYALLVDPADANTVWASTNAGLFVSTDAALTWSNANAGLPTRTIRSMTFDLQRGTLHVGTDQGVWSRGKAGRRRAVR
jgi:photosystem II stability/assembly factor-like uncharacterized protein